MSQTLTALLRLRELILSGALPPGERLSEPSVAERLGASRTPVRAALARLAEEGLVEAIPSRGFASGGHIACAGVGIPLPINWGLPDRPLWGAQAKQMDRDHFNHSMAGVRVHRHAEVGPSRKQDVKFSHRTAIIEERFVVHL